MYGYQYAQSGDAMKAFWTVAGLVLVAAVIAGVLLGGSELLSPSLHAAKADRLKVETAAFRAQAAYEQRQREIELRLAEEKAIVELQALQDRRAKELEFLELAAIVGLIVGSAVVAALVAAVTYYLIEKAKALPKGQAVKEIRRSDQKTLPSISAREQASISERATSPSSIQRSNVNPDRVSYDGFLAFCSDFVLSNGHQSLPLDYTRPDHSRRYYPGRMLPNVGKFYISILDQARIIIPGNNGCNEWVLDKRISKIDDISLRISPEAFYSQVIEWNNVGHSEKQTLAFREAHRRRESRPAA